MTVENLNGLVLIDLNTHKISATTSTARKCRQWLAIVGYIESFKEGRVDMANNTSEFGSIGQITIISKSGANHLRGSFFDYYSTPLFRARNPFAAASGNTSNPAMPPKSGQ